MSLSGRSAGTDLRVRLRRLLFMAPSIAQCSLGSAVAWVVARDLLGHQRPFFAPIAVVICVGITLGQRLRRLAELVVGVGLGIGVGDLLISRIGSGPWQIALVVAMAMAVAVLVDKGAVIAVQAGSSAVLVATLLPPSGTAGLDRMVDALVGGALGIVAIALLPANPAAIADRHASAVLEALATALEGTADAIEQSDLRRAEDALAKARGTQKAVEEFGEALKTGREIMIISPLRWRRRQQLLRYETARAPIDHALRNMRVLVRRTSVALRAGESVPSALPRTLRSLSHATLLLRDELAAGREPLTTRDAVLRIADELSSLPGGRSGFSADVMTAQLRSIIVDLLRATGSGGDSAIAALPRSPSPGEDGDRPAADGPDATGDGLRAPSR
jgi:uncharacterized membrane protein YgaE (UPF0421/DUF939 family)